MAWWDEQPMSQAGSASDQFYGAGGQPVSSYSSGGGMPMDAGPAYGFDSGYGALAGMSEGMPQGPQFDPQMQSLQHGMYAAGDQTPTAFTPDISPSGGGSWFKRLLSSTILGMAGGAGAPDPMTAFSAGYATVAAQRQQEARMAQQMQQQKQQQYMQELDRTKKNLELMKLAQEVEDMPEQNQAKIHERDEYLFQDLIKSGERPVIDFPATQQGMIDATNTSKDNKENLLGIGFPVYHDGRIYMFPNQSQTVTPKGYSIQIGGTNIPFEGQPWSAVADQLQKAKEYDFKEWQTKFEQQQANARNFASNQNQMNIAKLPSKSGNMPEWMQPGSFNDAQKSQLYSIDSKIAQLNREKQTAMQSPTADTSSYDARINQLYKQKQDLSDQFVQENQSRVTRTQPGQMIQTPAGPKPYGSPMTTKSGQTVYLIGIDSAGNPITTTVKP